MSRTYVIYKIKSLDPTVDYCYVGSTQNFTKRKCQHKNNCNVINKKNNTKLYNTMRENGGWINFQMTPIEEYKCDTPLQARMREQFWIENIEKNKLNSINAFISAEDRQNQIAEQKKEYRFKNRVQIAEQKKEYRFKNRDQIAELKKEYYFKNRDQIVEQQKEYYFKNRDQIVEQQKEYRFKNRDQKKEYDFKNRDKAQRNYIWRKISKEFLSILLDE